MKILRNGIFWSGVIGVLTIIGSYFAAVHGARLGAIAVREDENQERTAPKISAIICRGEDIWFTGGCNKCHGDTPMGGTVRDWENEYTFHIKSPQPVTIVSATVEVYRVKFFQRHYTLSPTTDLGNIQYRPARTGVQPAYAVCNAAPESAPRPEFKTAPEWVPRPEFKTARIVLSNLRDEKQILPTVPLGQIDVYSNDTVSLTFSDD